MTVSLQHSIAGGMFSIGGGDDPSPPNHRTTFGGPSHCKNDTGLRGTRHTTGRAGKSTTAKTNHVSRSIFEGTKTARGVSLSGMNFAIRTPESPQRPSPPSNPQATWAPSRPRPLSRLPLDANDPARRNLGNEFGEEARLVAIKKPKAKKKLDIEN